MYHVGALQHLAEDFGDFDARSTDQDSTAFLEVVLDGFDDGVILLTLGAIDQIVEVLTLDVAVRGDHDHVKLVDLVELTGLGLCRTGHAGQLVIQAEVVLQRDRGERLCVLLDDHAFLCFDGLMQTVGIATSLEDTTRKLVNDLHLAVLHDVLIIDGVQRVGPEQLVDDVDTVRPFREQAHHLVLHRLAVIGRQVGIAFDHAHLCGDVGDHEHFRILVRLRQQGAAFLRDINLVVLLVDREVELVVDLVHALPLVAQVVELGVTHQLQVVRILQHLGQTSVLRHGAVGTQQGNTGLCFVVLGRRLQKLFGLGYKRVGELRLNLVDPLDARIRLDEGLVAAGCRDGTRDDQRRTGFVDKDGVNLVNDGKPVRTLNHVLRIVHHVIAEVVKAEFVVRAVGDVAVILGLAHVRRHVRLDATGRDAKHIEQGLHPLTVTAGQVVVHRHQVYTAACKSIQVEGQSGNERLTLTRGHFRDLARVQYHATDQLHVVRDHVPYLLVAYDHVAVSDETARRFLDQGECFGQNIIECRLHHRELLLVELAKAGIGIGTVVVRHRVVIMQPLADIRSLLHKIAH